MKRLSDEEESERIVIRVPKSWVTALSEMAKSGGYTVSDMVRDAVKQYLKKAGKFGK